MNTGKQILQRIGPKKNIEKNSEVTVFQTIIALETVKPQGYTTTWYMECVCACTPYRLTIRRLNSCVDQVSEKLCVHYGMYSARATKC